MVMGGQVPAGVCTGGPLMVEIEGTGWEEREEERVLKQDFRAASRTLGRRHNVEDDRRS